MDFRRFRASMALKGGKLTAKRGLIPCKLLKILINPPPWNPVRAIEVSGSKCDCVALLVASSVI
jgi:hypothetical protein